jgi:hypothetical protein
MATQLSARVSVELAGGSTANCVAPPPPVRLKAAHGSSTEIVGLGSRVSEAAGDSSSSCVGVGDGSRSGVSVVFAVWVRSGVGMPARGRSCPASGPHAAASSDSTRSIDPSRTCEPSAMCIPQTSVGCIGYTPRSAGEFRPPRMRTALPYRCPYGRGVEAFQGVKSDIRAATL